MTVKEKLAFSGLKTVMRSTMILLQLEISLCLFHFNNSFFSSDI